MAESGASNLAYGVRSSRDLHHSQYYNIYSTYLVKQTNANSVDPEQTPRNATSDLSLRRLPLIQRFRHIDDEYMYMGLVEILGQV